MSIESMMPSNHLILCCPLLFLPSIFPSIRVFPISQLFTSGGQRIGVSTSESVFPMNIQSWIPLGLNGLISLLSKGVSRVFSSTTVWKYPLFSVQPSLWSNYHIHTWLLEKTTVASAVSVYVTMEVTDIWSPHYGYCVCSEIPFMLNTTSKLQ